MAAINLKFIETYLTNSEDEAEQLVLDIKKSNGYTVIAHTITKKVKKEMEYYIVKITKEYNSEKELLDKV
jgi:hypothetical protein